MDELTRMFRVENCKFSYVKGSWLVSTGGLSLRPMDVLCESYLQLRQEYNAVCKDNCQQDKEIEELTKSNEEKDTEIKRLLSIIEGLELALGQKSTNPVTVESSRISEEKRVELKGQLQLLGFHSSANLLLGGIIDCL